MLNFVVNSSDETKKIAMNLAQFLKSGDLILLHGDLGVGKTTFTKGLAQGLGIQNIIKSPTFNIIKEYSNEDVFLYHMDFYRLEYDGVDGLGLEEYFYGNGISVIEWPEFGMNEIPNTYLSIFFYKDNYIDSKRVIKFISHGGHYNKLLDKLKSLV